MENPLQPPVDYEKKYRKLIIILSIVIPVAVAGLFGVKIKGFDTHFLPPIYATINGITAIVLLMSLAVIKNKRIELHRRLNNFAIILSCLFLLLYIVYHITSGETKFGDLDGDWKLSDAEKAAVGATRYLYYFVLITHITLSVVVIPFVLFTYVKGWSMKVEAHKKLAHITYPMWLYVAISGVVVYLMLSPYYR